jgi:hypothetical protein
MDVDACQFYGIGDYSIWLMNKVTTVRGLSSLPYIYKSSNLYFLLPVPAAAPRVPCGWFRTESCDSIASECSVTLYWMVSFEI